MQTQYGTKNMPAGILIIVTAALNLLIRVINYFQFYGGPGSGVFLLQFLFGGPLVALWLVALIAAGALLLARVRQGAAGAFFVLGAVNIMWVAQSFTYFSPAPWAVFNILSMVAEAAAFIIAGVICIAPDKVPHTTGFAALPCFIMLAAAIFYIIEVIASLSLGFGNAIALSILRMFVVLGGIGCRAFALLCACQWALDGFLPTRAPLQPAGSNTAAAGTLASEPRAAESPATWFCPNCGRAGNTGTFCPGCGTQVPEAAVRGIAAAHQAQTGQQDIYGMNAAAGQPAPYGQANPLDTGSFGWAVLGFFVPLVGLILWLTWKSDRPKSAKMAGMGALISVIAEVIITVIGLIVIAAVGSSMMYY